MPIKPSTTLGMAANNSIPAFRTSFIFKGATSAIYIAQPTPIGIEIIAAPNVTRSEPNIRGSMPNCGGSEIGYQLFPNKN